MLHCHEIGRLKPRALLLIICGNVLVQQLLLLIFFSIFDSKNFHVPVVDYNLLDL